REYVDMRAFSGKIVSDVYDNGRYYRYDFRLDSVLCGDTVHRAVGLIHLYFYRDSTFRPSYGDELYVKGFFRPIPGPRNPSEFDYRLYMGRSGIYGQSFVSTAAVRLMHHRPDNRILAWAYHTRKALAHTIGANIPTERERQIAWALVLGIREALGEDIRTAYASAGAMHVLAVSGLHVGIVYGLLMGIFGGIGKWKKLRILRFAVVVSGVWAYALVTGLPASVMRAATMFTVIALQELTDRKANIYNSLGFAALVLLVYDPSFIYSVGFQLSFTAVTGIVYLYPRFYGLFHLSGWLGDKVFSVTCLSLAAQLATAPLTIYYFHQFPSYFLLSNLVVIPGAFLIMVMVFPLFVVDLLGFSIAGGLGWLLGKILFVVNELVFLTEGLPYSLITWLYLTGGEVVLLYGVMIFTFASVHYRSFVAFGLAAMLAMVFSFSYHLRKLDSIKQARLVVYAVRGKTAIDLIEGRSARLYVNNLTRDDLDLVGHQVDPFRLASGLPPISTTPSDWTEAFYQSGPFSLLEWRGVRILLVREPFRNPEFTLKADVVIVAMDKPMDWGHLMGVVEARQLVISPQVSAWDARRLGEAAKNKGVFVHDVGKDGYWMLDLEQNKELWH
ncbi:MAG: ComEC family competence protein, partial [Cyclobacteriaceae bacterium]|nr:ComEC family competence protein [Cyclobacteriaceae bacterium]